MIYHGGIIRITYSCDVQFNISKRLPNATDVDKETICRLVNKKCQTIFIPKNIKLVKSQFINTYER